MESPRGAQQEGAPAHDPATSLVRSALRTLLTFAQTRVRIAGNELEEQTLRLFEIAVWILAAVALFSIGLLLLAAFVVLVFWDSNRVLASALLAGLFFAGGGISVLMARSCMAARPKFLAVTLAEFEKDARETRTS